MNILIVDDEETIRKGIRRAIVSFFPDMKVCMAGSAEEALRILRQQPVDLALLDIMMPEMNGIELMGILKNKYPNLVRIVISAHSEFSFAQEALRLGASDYILKPVGKQKLKEIIVEMEAQWNARKRNMSDTDLVQINLRYLREAVFRRWSQGFDIGRFDMSELARQFPIFHLVLVRLQTNEDLSLKHFIVENVLTELIDTCGSGFVVGLDGKTLLGIITLKEDVAVKGLEEETHIYLQRALKAPYLLQTSARLTDFSSIPDTVESMRAAEKTDAQPNPAGKNSYETIDIAIQYIVANFNENLSLQKVASVVFLNPVYFSQLFKQKTGTGYKEYLTQLRLERAKALLADTNMKIIDIAYSVGYHDIRHFTQVFRNKYRMTPSKLRAALEHDKPIATI
jgi:two-component system response regulator YesN